MKQQQNIYDLAVAGIRQLIPYQPGKPITELQRELGLQQVIKLASNENPLGPGPKAVQAIRSALPELARYPDGNGFELKRALADKFGVDVRQLTLGNGSNEILELVARTFLTSRSEVIFSQHAFAVYPLVTQAVGATAKVVAAVNYGHDLEAMLRQVTANTGCVFIANPNNPTGTYLTHGALETFLQALPDRIICVLDEAYFEFVNNSDYPKSIQWLAQYPNLLITRTFSKAYGLAGLRIGYALSGLAVADLLNRARQPFNCNALALVAAEAALQDVDFLQQSVDNNHQGMQQITAALQKLHLTWIPSVGNFVSIDLRQPALPVYEALLKRGVIVRPVANYELPNHLRVSIGTKNENQCFIDALTAVIKHV